MSKLKINQRFATTPVEILNNPKISLKAKGLYGYLQSKPDGWDFTLGGIASQLKEGKESIREGVKELEIAGYLQRTNYQNEKGQWDCDYELFAIKTNTQPLSKKEKPHTEKPHTETSETVKPPHKVRKIESKIDQVKEIKEKENKEKKFEKNLELKMIQKFG